MSDDRARSTREIIDAVIQAREDIVKMYFKKVDDSLINWQAVKEDFIESYTRLIETTPSQEFRDVFSMIIDDFKKHIRILREIADMMQSMVDDEVTHRMDLLALRE